MKKKGSTLLVVLIIMMVTFSMAAMIIDVSIKNNRQTLATINNTRAYYTAEAGIYDFINYIKNNNLNVTTGTYLINFYNNGGLYSDNMASYKASLTDTITENDSGNSKLYSFTIYSSGKYDTVGSVIVANVTLFYLDDGNGNYSYDHYLINTRKVFKA